MKTNYTLQVIFNNGFQVVESLAISVQTTATQIAPVTAGPFNGMFIKGNGDISGGERMFIGDSAVTTLTGLPLFDFDGNGRPSNTANLIFIPTNNPSSFYLVGNVANIDARIMLVTYIP
jgi:hypothetical protein